MGKSEIRWFGKLTTGVLNPKQIRNTNYQIFKTGVSHTAYYTAGEKRAKGKSLAYSVQCTACSVDGNQKSEDGRQRTEGRGQKGYQGIRTSGYQGNRSSKFKV